MQKETWKDVIGYEGLYQVSSYGRVFSLISNKYLSLCNSSGYNRVILSKNGMSKYIHVHRLVANAFISNPYKKPCIDHIDGNRRNNKIDNLRWVTYCENNNNEITKNRIKTMVKISYIKGRKYPYMKLQKKIICVETGTKYNSLKEAQNKTGISRSSICMCCKKQRQTAGGYHWKYAEKEAC